MAVARWFLRPPGWRMRVRGEGDAEGETEARNEVPGALGCLTVNEVSLSESYDTPGDGIALRFIGWIRPMMARAAQARCASGLSFHTVIGKTAILIEGAAKNR